MRKKGTEDFMKGESREDGEFGEGRKPQRRKKMRGNFCDDKE